MAIRLRSFTRVQTGILKFVAYFVAFLLLRLLVFAVQDLMRIGQTSKVLTAVFQHGKRKQSPQDYFPSDQYTHRQLSVRCGNLNSYDALMIVHIDTADLQRRNDYRSTYGDYGFTKPRRIKVVFLLGQHPNQDFQMLIVKEHKMFQDIVQGSFIDAPMNLTYKAIMGFRWVAEQCTFANVILKVDSNTLVDVPRFFEEVWPPPMYIRDMIHCQEYLDSDVKRQPDWASKMKDYNIMNIPHYCNGFFVAIPFSIAGELYRTARKVPLVWLDDVFIYGLAVRKSTYIQLVNTDALTANVEEYEKCKRNFGTRCKIVATVQNGRDFTSSLMSFLRKN